ncbi:MAG: EamA family transporter [Candidatus Omnitrophota bacterium]|jgi:drug/metabolite transporter (DMT)-like permease
MKKNRLTWSILLLIVTNDTCDSLAQLLMKKGLVAPAGSLGFHEIFGFLSHNAGSWMVWLGVLIYTLNFLIWIAVLSRLDLSIAVPVASTNYITLPILAMIFLHEQVSWLRWAGIALIIAGIHFVSKSARLEPAAQSRGGGQP